MIEINDEELDAVALALAKRDFDIYQKVHLPKEGALTFLKRYYKQLIQENNLDISEVYRRGEKVLGVFLGISGVDDWLATDAKVLICWCSPGSVTAKTWIISQLKSNLAWYDEKISLQISQKNFDLIPFFEKEGFYSDLLLSCGDVERGLKRLIEKKKPLLNFDFWGLKHVELQSNSQVDSVINILNSEFNRNKTYKWFKAQKNYLDLHKRKIKEMIDNPLSRAYGLFKDKKLLGYFGYGIDPKGSIWGKAGGVEVILSESLKGEGIIKTIYAISLEELVKKKVNVIKGGTSQPAMFHMYKILGREKVAILLRYGNGKHTPLSDFL